MNQSHQDTELSLAWENASKICFTIQEDCEFLPEILNFYQKHDMYYYFKEIRLTQNGKK